jgi:hypothetical protein
VRLRLSGHSMFSGALDARRKLILKMLFLWTVQYFYNLMKMQCILLLLSSHTEVLHCFTFPILAWSKCFKSHFFCILVDMLTNVSHMFVTFFSPKYVASVYTFWASSTEGAQILSIKEDK